MGHLGDISDKKRLVAKGLTQTHDIDYLETFAPVAKLISVKGVKNDFLNGDLEDKVYMDGPPGFEGRFGLKVCILKKSLYGLNNHREPDLGGSLNLSKIKGIVISQWKYVLDLLEETRVSGCRPPDAPNYPNQKLGDDKEVNHVDISRFQKLVGKLIIHHIHDQLSHLL
ncbi:uncharacterized protein LOC142512465 [Primulina tabacum]|uniref:uncharacterized protein LOC142512465 n=1 Tax=Primulina tabacum TaxID=48773 RepID=UPI003F5A93B4